MTNLAPLPPERLAEIARDYERERGLGGIAPWWESAIGDLLSEVARLAAELDAAKKGRDEAEAVAWALERGFRFLAEVKDLDPASDSAGDLSRSWAPFIVLLEATDIDGFGWLLQLEDKNRIEDNLLLLRKPVHVAAIQSSPAFREWKERRNA